MARPGVKVRDLGFAKIIKELEAAGQSYTTVGVHADAEPHTSDDGTVEAVLVASANEFGAKADDGTELVPERSFMRTTMDEQRSAIADLQERVINRVVAGKGTAEQGLGLIGQYAEAKVKAKIASGVPPPNAPATIAKKGSSKTLIDSGQMRQSITNVVHTGGARPKGEG